MTISTKGRYALRVLIDLAENNNGSYIPMKVVAQRQTLPLKYLERILPVLTQNNIIESVHGKGGGYRLTRKPEDYTVGEILRLVEGDFAPVACLGHDAKPCEMASKCRTITMWKKFKDVIDEFFDGITLKDLMNDDLQNEAGVECSFLDAAL